MRRGITCCNISPVKAIKPLDLSMLRVFPLQERQSLTRIDDLLVPVLAAPPPVCEQQQGAVHSCVLAIRRARASGASVILMYGAHLIRNGAALILSEMLKQGWFTHLATNGAGSIHDWEYSWLGRSTESVATNVAAGNFGTWDETARYIHLALLSGSIHGEGYGVALGRFIAEDGVTLPSSADLETMIRDQPDHPLASARVDLLRAMRQFRFASGRIAIEHRWKHASMLASAFRHQIPATVHPGIGYDIVSCHPIFNGGVIGRCAELDFKLFAGAVENLDGGVCSRSVLRSWLRRCLKRPSVACTTFGFKLSVRPVRGFDIFVVDLQDSGNWDWSQGEPPKDNPAYYLRFCKSFSRMGGKMRYVQCDNVAFVHNLFHELQRTPA